MDLKFAKLSSVVLLNFGFLTTLSAEVSLFSPIVDLFKSPPLPLFALNEQKADGLFNAHYSNETPGCSVGVQKDGLIVYQKGFGVAKFWSDKPSLPNSFLTRFRIASITKPIIAIGVLKLREQLLAKKESDLLDRRLDQIFNELKDTFYAGIKVRQLLNHTSGLNREPAADCDPDSDNDIPTCLAKHIEVDDVLIFDEPGKKYAYSNLGYMTAAAIVTKLSGKDYKTYYADEVFKPLELTVTQLADAQPLQRAGNVAEEYGLNGKDFEALDLENRRYLLGSGGVISSVPDLFKLSKVVRERKFLTPDSWKQILTGTPLAKASGEDLSYGLGWSQDSDDPTKVTELSHSGGGYGANNFLLIKDVGITPCRVTTAVLCNWAKDDFDSEAVARSLAKLYCE